MKRNYIDNDILELEIAKSQLAGQMTEQLGEMCIEIAEKIMHKGGFRMLDSDLKQACISSALLHLVKHLCRLYVPGRGKGFSLASHIAHWGVLHEIDKHRRYARRQKLARDAMMSEMTQDEI